MSGFFKFLGVAAIVALACVSFVRIEPDEIGVCARNVGERGIVPHDFAPGIHLAIPFVFTWTRLPAKVRRVEMVRDTTLRGALGGEALTVQSSDGDRVVLDLNIMYRVHPGEGYLLVRDSGVGDSHVTTLKNLASDRLRATFGTLRTEEFYDSDKRYAKSREAVAALRASLANIHLDVVDLLIQDVVFDPKYEEKIRDKKLADQNAELAKSEAVANKENAHVQEIKIDTDKQKKVIAAKAAADALTKTSEANKYAVETKADADLYASQQKAKGDFALAHAQAQVKAARNDAMGAAGAANYIALEAANSLNIPSLVLPTTPNQAWFDVNEMARKLGAKAQ